MDVCQFRTRSGTKTGTEIGMAKKRLVEIVIEIGTENVIAIEATANVTANEVSVVAVMIAIVIESGKETKSVNVNGKDIVISGQWEWGVVQVAQVVQDLVSVIEK